MRWYFVVEGRQTEKKIYKAWLQHAFPSLEAVRRIEDMAEDRYYLIAGNGYPSYLDRIREAVENIRAEPGRFDHLWVCVDSEERTAEACRAEIDDIIAGAVCPVASTVVVQHCCIETWLLGNRKVVKRNPQSEILRELYDHYDVLTRDPEGLPALPPRYPLRAALHEAYLRELFRERNRPYNKHHPSEACDLPYLRELIGRVDETEHLQSLRLLIACWRELGARV
ncbi:MAG TPA: hypothetical protein VNM90_06380 [Haliangium sp.]|nr:hypothetical protein [Haliangium sp.]